MIDTLIHAPARLEIMAALAVLPEGDALRFPVLRGLTNLTAGNLAVHLRRLQEAGLVELRTSGRGRGSATLVALTHAGRIAFDAYRSELFRLLKGPTP